MEAMCRDRVVVERVSEVEEREALAIVSALNG
jgi:hypothetical protein